MTYNVFSGTLNPTHSLLTHVYVCASKIIGHLNVFETCAFQLYGMSDAYANVLQYFNVALTCVFAVEAVVKLIGFGLRVSALST